MEDAVPNPHDELVLDGEVAFRADLDNVRHLENFYVWRDPSSINTWWRSQHFVALRIRNESGVEIDFWLDLDQVKCGFTMDKVVVLCRRLG